MAKDYKDILFGDKKKDDNSGGGAGFPGVKRKTAGKAEKISADDLKKAEKDRKDPWPTCICRIPKRGKLLVYKA